MVLADSMPNKYICGNYVHIYMNMTIFMGIGSGVCRLYNVYIYIYMDIKEFLSR